jgi:uncharacterized protein DUF3883
MLTSHVSADDVTGTDWSAREIDLIIADYFDMFRMELAGQPVNKAARNRAMQELTGRSRGSIEFKHQNISAVLDKLGYPWIEGYKPRFNFQAALVDGIERLPGGVPAFLENALGTRLPPLEGFAEASPIPFEQAPLLDPRIDEPPPALKRLIRKFDPAARDERNRSLGRQGEERILLHERSALRALGRPDLSNKVRWVAQEDGDGAGYDILSFTPDGRERLLEVKTTVGARLTPFFLTQNERLVSEEHPDAFRIVRLFDFARAPRAFELHPPLESSIIMRPHVYRATFTD